MNVALPQPLDFLYALTPVFQAGEHPAEPPCYFSLPDIHRLNAHLLKPNRFFLENGPRQRLEEALVTMGSGDPDCALSLTTASAYQNEVPEIIANALGQRFACKRVQLMNIRTCLHEAIANAVIHGNLGLTGRIESPDDFTAYYRAIAARMDTVPYKDRRIFVAAWNSDVCLHLAVTDQGQGFPDGAILTEAPMTQRKSGRGLFIMRALANRVWIGGDNKTICMTFNH